MGSQATIRFWTGEGEVCASTRARTRMKIRKQESAHLASGRLLLLLLLLLMMMMKLVSCACTNAIVNYASILAFACA